ncbi:MAG: hypothetical protein JO147_03235 [Actinobacteria bacterium]|nr:hypothetical protein [Actinomycetota bacterium]
MVCAALICCVSEFIAAAAEACAAEADFCAADAAGPDALLADAAPVRVTPGGVGALDGEFAVAEGCGAAAAGVATINDVISDDAAAITAIGRTG